jgi:hypothetical protein
MADQTEALEQERALTQHWRSRYHKAVRMGMEMETERDRLAASLRIERENSKRLRIQASKAYGRAENQNTVSGRCWR